MRTRFFSRDKESYQKQQHHQISFNENKQPSKHTHKSQNQKGSQQGIQKFHQRNQQRAINSVGLNSPFTSNTSSQIHVLHNKGSNPSLKQQYQEPIKEQYPCEENYPKYIKELQEQDKNININLSSKKNSQAFVNLQRKMKFNLIKNAYTKKSSSLNKNQNNFTYFNNNIVNTNNTNQASSKPPNDKKVDSLNRNISKSFGTNNTCVDIVQTYQHTNCHDHQRYDSAMFHLDDLSFCDKQAPFELKKILPTNIAHVKNDSYSMLKIENPNVQVRGIYKTNTYNPKSKTTKASPTTQLMEKGKKFFKQNDFENALNIFQEIIKQDKQLLEAYYFVGVCLLSQCEYEKSANEFLALIDKNPMYRRNVYILAAIAFKKQNKLEQAILMLTQCMQKFPKYYDAYVYRGQLYVKQKCFDKALRDYSQAIQINEEKGLAYLEKADCLKHTGKFQEAIEMYSKAIDVEDQLVATALLKRAICYIDFQNQEYGLLDLQRVLELDNSNSEAYYYKGIILQKNLNSNEAILSFEQAIKHNNSKKAVTKSLYEISKIQIQQRDFYSAFHTLQRSDFIDTDQKFLDKFKLFTEAVLFLMKRKFKEALDIFNQLSKQPQLGEFIKPLFHVYRAYGYFCQGKHQLALQEYNQASQNQEVDDNSLYNKYLCEGIISIEHGSYQSGIQFFEKAAFIFKNKMEPLFYKTVALINMSFNQDDDQKRNTQNLIQGLKEIDQAVEINDTVSNLFYYRAILRCYMGYFNEGIQDIDKAIEKSEDNVPKYFYLRGHCFGCCKSHKQAINDISICLQLDENFADAYLERSKNYLQIGDCNQAFADLQKYISLKPEDCDIHKWAGNLLFNSGAYEDAIEAYSHSDNLKNDPLLLYLRSQCHLMIRNIPDTIQDLQDIFALTQDPFIELDISLLQALQLIIEKKDIESTLQKLEEQIIETNFGKIFKEYDVYLYMGVIRFYSGQFEQVIKEFMHGSIIKEQYDIDNFQKKGSDSSIILNSQTDIDKQETLIEYRDSFSQNQIFYNIAICHLMMNDLKQACDNLLRLEVFQEDEITNLEILLKFIYREIKSENDSGQIINLSVFSSDGKLCEFFPSILQQLQNSQIEIKPSFNLPKVISPSMQPEFQESLLKDFKVTNIENKPEAPWIKRCMEGIIFTDNVLIAESIDVMDTEEKDLKKKEQQEQEVDEIYEKQKHYYDSNEQIKNPKNINEIKQNLKLDEDIEEKLNKLIKNKKAKEQKQQNQQ